MSIYKPGLLDKFKDFVNGLKANWDDYEQHKADYETHKADYETHKADYETHKADYETHKADYETHQAESASKHITESGSNDDGHYIKFDDGTMICYREGTLTIPGMTQLPNGLWRAFGVGHFFFPATFNAVLFAEMKLQAGEEINCSPRILTNSYYNTNITTESDLSGQTRRYFLFAIGRWK